MKIMNDIGIFFSFLFTFNLIYIGKHQYTKEIQKTFESDFVQ